MVAGCGQPCRAHIIELGRRSGGVPSVGGSLTPYQGLFSWSGGLPTCNKRQGSRARICFLGFVGHVVMTQVRAATWRHTRGNCQNPWLSRAVFWHLTTAMPATVRE